jgi:dTDP-4-amino-4,6-dideoxygalactose transaminase
MKKLALFGGEKTRKDSFPPFPVIGDEEVTAVVNVIKSSQLSGFIAAAGDKFSGGPKVQELEENIKQYFSVKYAVTLNSATAGLHCAFEALNLNEDDEVIVPPYTMSATASAVVMAGAIPVFADIDENSFCLSPDAIKKVVTKKTKAICVVHLFGNPADMDEIMIVAKENNLKVIEDCAQAPGALYKDRLVGKIGDIGVFSFNQHKTITTGEGGFSITNDDSFATRMRLVRNHGEAVVEDMDLDETFSNVIGYNYRMTELEAAIGLIQFSKMDKLNNLRIELAEFVIENLSGIEGLVFPDIEKEKKHVYFLLPVKMDSDTLCISRDQFVDALNAEGIPFGKGYVKPLYLLPYFQTGKLKHKYQKGICPVAERLHFEQLTNSAPMIFRYPMNKSDMNEINIAFKKILDNKEEFVL